MEPGYFRSNMSDILNNLNTDQDSISWWHLAACRGIDTNLFFDKYELDTNIAKSIDQCCLSCPVINMCYKSGIENNEYGVWGGVYLNAGSNDKMRNSHKTRQIWVEIKKRHNVI